MHAKIHVQRRVGLAGVLLAAGGLLAACGLSSASGSHPGDAHGADENDAPTTPVPGGVRLVLDQSAYHQGDTARVLIENGLPIEIGVTDHHTDCGYTELQQFSGGRWTPIGTCRSMRPTRRVTLAAGSTTPQSIGIPGDPSMAGTYRVALTYAPGENASVAQPEIIYSPTFTIA